MKSGAAPVGRVVAAGLPAMLLAWHRIDAVDFWSELATGRFIVRHGFPAHDPFGTARDSSWIIQDWLSSVAAFALHSLGGLPLVVASAAIATAVALVLPGLAAA